MASCCLGASGIKLPKLDFDRVRVGNLRQLNGTRTWLGRRQVQYVGLTVSYEPKKVFSICCGPKLETESATNRVDDFKGIESSGLTSQLIPNSSEVEALVSEICNTTSIAEFEMKVGGFRLYVMRDLTEKSKLPPLPTLAPASAPAPAPSNSTALASPSVSVDTISKAPDSNGSVSSTSLVVSKPVPFSGGIKSFLDRAADEGLIILQSPRVGFFRRSRTIKGQLAPPSCKEKQIVKEGQVICFIEQLGGELPIESDVSGEVIKILREDGEPVGYGDALIAILPSFPGIKKLHQ
ncbi:biotin carboxyl carrier protein of acetyl-CoA carboxylase [Manihot esculenta]|uniref:Lipoyl-binding domain-containing protein n=1 Tax=Manihot esculenta TaxID=3983 RepID=A0A2C9V055_MANES|nr:biotin carboxyl carrier protein of acetyl-CoA carboxylase [Manihot esculenta]OAY36837.1 hypothetical protein MANES_11G052800v8 [Manihot esculenta]